MTLSLADTFLGTDGVADVQMDRQTEIDWTAGVQGEM